MNSSLREPYLELALTVERVASEAEALVRLWDRAEDWTVPRISPSQLKVLSALRHRGPMNLSALAGTFGAIPSSMSRLCDRLEAAGLARRDVPVASRREVSISLTPEGRRRLDTLDRARRDDFAPVLERMARDDRAALLDGLSAFTVAAEDEQDGDLREA